MTCRETRPLLPLFFDGELDPRQMRAVALHSTRCGECEGELRELEQLQELVATHVTEAVDAIDLACVWQGVAPRLAMRKPSRLRRVRTWWSEREHVVPLRAPMMVAAAAAVVVLAVGVWWRDTPGTTAELSPRVDNSAVLDSVQSSVDSVALVTDEQTNTTLLWIMDDAGAAADQAVEQWEGLK
jgi:anti-sigma-K factor RskA